MVYVGRQFSARPHTPNNRMVILSSSIAGAVIKPRRKEVIDKLKKRAGNIYIISRLFEAAFSESSTSTIKDKLKSKREAFHNAGLVGKMASGAIISYLSGGKIRRKPFSERVEREIEKHPSLIVPLAVSDLLSVIESSFSKAINGVVSFPRGMEFVETERNVFDTFEGKPHASLSNVYLHAKAQLLAYTSIYDEISQYVQDRPSRGIKVTLTYGSLSSLLDAIGAELFYAYALVRAYVLTISSHIFVNGTFSLGTEREEFNGIPLYTPSMKVFSRSPIYAGFAHRVGNLLIRWATQRSVKPQPIPPYSNALSSILLSLSQFWEEAKGGGDLSIDELKNLLGVDERLRKL